MPNHVINKLIISGTKIDRDKLKSQMAWEDSDGSKEIFSFNSILPMPAELIGTTSGSYVLESLWLVDKSLYESFVSDHRESNSVKFAIARGSVVESELLEVLKKFASYGNHPAEFTDRSEALQWFSENKPEVIELGKFHAAAVKSTGFLDWYEWSIVNWGTKWDAYKVNRTETDEKLIYTFETAWSQPAPVINKLITMYPNLCFEHHYFDEMDNFWGINNYVGGSLESERSSHLEDKVTLCIELKGVEPDEEEEFKKTKKRPRL